MLSVRRDKDLYLKFFEEHKDIPIFSSPWWLDATAGKHGWDVVLVEEEGKFIASFPYMIKRGKCGDFALTMPQLTQKLGVYIVYEEGLSSDYKKIEYENNIYEQIIQALPKFSFFAINFDCIYKNWLQFYWNGFNQTTRYTYRLHAIKDTGRIFESFEKSKRKKIKRGEKAFDFKQDLDAETFYTYFEYVINSRNEKVSYTKEFFYKLYEEVYKHDAGRSFYCVDKVNGNIAALKFIVWDSNTAYDIIGIRMKEYNSSGSTEFLTYECIKYVSQHVDIFDFEGSMIKGVEDAYRGYGTKQTEYYSISKDRRLIRPALGLVKRWLKSFRK